jgi:endonuclease/exonuclease/phosphatase family metal-dependent hydrolase
MVSAKKTIRIATYNIHKCRGLDRRVSAERIARVLREMDADIVAMQEVVRVNSETASHDQSLHIAAETGYLHHCFGETRPLLGGIYGNATLSRWPIEHWNNYDLSHAKRERRGCLRTDIRVHGKLVHVMNVHLGTGFMERRAQARTLLGPRVLGREDLKTPRLVVGDFNEWTRGLVTSMLSAQFASAELKPRPWRMRSYPGVLPVLHLDHMYFDPTLRLENFRLHRSRLALVASDHLPLVAEFELS